MRKAPELLLKSADWPDPVEIFNESGASPVVLICEHASNYMPAEYRGLGLTDGELADHIAWDIGAADVTRRLSTLLDAPAFLGTYSRLLIDLNRPLGVPGSIVQKSEATDIAGNHGLSPAERTRREQRIFIPFHKTVGACLDAREAQGKPTLIACIHSFTPVFLGKRRPWHAGIVYGGAREFSRRLLDRLASDSSLVIGENEPYTITLEDDYALPVHGDDRKIVAMLIEIRHDGLASERDRQAWAKRLADALVIEMEAGW